MSCRVPGLTAPHEHASSHTGHQTQSATRESSHRLINAKEVARMLGCSWRTVLRLADAGVIPWGLKLGSLRRWDSHQIEDFIASGGKRGRKPGR
jgi:excisionase family DNA binding protein